MAEIEMITLPRMRLAQLQSFTESFQEIVEPVTVLAPQALEVATAFTAFQESMSDDGPTSEKRALDKVRDRYISCLLDTIENEKHYPHDDAGKATVDQVAAIADRYGHDITRLPYDDQSSATHNMLNAMEEVGLSGMHSIERWVIVARAANETFKESANTFRKDQLAAPVSGTKAAPALESAMQKLFSVLYAKRLLGDTEELQKVHEELQALVDDYS